MDLESREFENFLQSKKADQCFHKDGTFLSHLLEVYRIIKNWNAPEEVCRFACFHSFLGTSWVTVDLGSDRKELQDLIGEKAEALVFHFSKMDRMRFTFELVLGKLYDMSVIPDTVMFDGEAVSKRTIAIYILVTIADWLQQFSSYMDNLFQVDKRGDLATFFQDILEKKVDRLENPAAIWPGNWRPANFLHVLSRLNRVLQKCEQKDLVCPILTDLLTMDQEVEARDLYCECRQKPLKETIQRAIENNPHVPEFYNVLAQICLSRQEFEEAEQAASYSMRLFELWGTSWDKSVTWDAWKIHTKLLLNHAKKKTWCKTAMEIIDLVE